MNVDPDGYCSIHQVVEHARVAYRICVECGHVYQEALELQREWVANYPRERGDRSPMAPPADEIWFCPLCMHDF